jgi:hypothetical protein
MMPPLGGAVGSGHVFLSYSTADRALAEDLSRRLEAKGVPVWIAPRDIPPGSDYSEAIEEALDTSSAVVALVSAGANASRHVKAEIEIAFSRGKPLFPVRFQDIQPAKGLSLFLSLGHWTDLFGAGEAASLERLAAELAGRSGAPRAMPAPIPSPPGDPRPPAQPRPQPRTGISTRFLVAIIALSLVVIASVAAIAILRKAAPDGADSESGQSGTSPSGGSLWNHNGSLVRLQASGRQRSFVYFRPQRRVPARPGDVVFRGQRNGSAYRGTAYQYSSQCGRIGYAVEGSVAPGERQVSLRGNAPVRDSGCQVVGSRPDRLVFRFVRAG